MNPTTRLAPMLLALATTVVLSGCASSLSGVGSTERFACQAPIGAQCTSISGVYANANPLAARGVHETPVLPPGLITSTRRTQIFAPTGASTGATSGTSTDAAASPPPAALRSPPRVARLWIAPWEDADGDLHDASLIHVVIDTGRWLIERVRPAPRSKLDIATPPLVPLPAPAPAPDARQAPDLAPSEP